MSDTKNTLLRTLVTMIGFLVIAAFAMFIATGDILQALIAVGSMGAMVLLCFAPIAFIFIFVGRKIVKRNSPKA